MSGGRPPRADRVAPQHCSLARMSISADGISARLGSGDRLTEAEARALASSAETALLGKLAGDARRRRHARRATFARVADVPLAEGAVGFERPGGTGELRIVGTPGSLDQAIAVARDVRAAAGLTPVSGFSLSDLELLADRAGESLATVLVALRDAGLELIAEAPIDRLRDPGQALAAAVQAGLLVARLTVHDPVDRDGIATCLQVAALQDLMGSLRVFAPLPRRVQEAQPATGDENARRVALARLLVDNIDTIQVDWTLCGPALAQAALACGADDVDAVSAVDTRAGGRRGKPLEEIRRRVRAASLVPAERNGRFELVTP
jgi:hypothetical protein